MCIEVLGPLLSAGRAMKTSSYCLRHQKILGWQYHDDDDDAVDVCDVISDFKIQKIL